MKYLDTSAFVKHYRNNEEGSAIVHKLIEDMEDGKEEVISSFLVVGETVSVFDKWTRYKFVSSDECVELVKKFIKDVKELSDNGTLILEPMSTSTITNCLDLITKHHLSLNDAVHLG
ncbi:type II toxin-antitoxin system VapC family toxin [Candidatus Woesearchaeota archaeon]|nr:type II toxin-antitoxin system VapC family toxin [Candidatus Woesearchaeota archaeon]